MGKCCLHATSFILFESSLKLLVTRTGIKARSGSILGRIRPLILELLALERQKFHTFELTYPVGQSWSNFMCSIIGVGEELHKVLGPWHIWLRWAIVALWATCLVYLIVLKSRGWGSGEDVPSILMCDTMCHWNTGIAPRNTSISHFADLCKLHWVILNVVSLNSDKFWTKQY